MIQYIKYTAHRLYCLHVAHTALPLYLLAGSFRPRYGSVEPSETVSVGALDNSVFEDAPLASAAPRAMFDEDQDSGHGQAPNNEPPPMHRSKSSLGAQSRGTCLHLHLSLFPTSLYTSQIPRKYFLDIVKMISAILN